MFPGVMHVLFSICNVGADDSICRYIILFTSDNGDIFTLAPKSMSAFSTFILNMETCNKTTLGLTFFLNGSF